MSVLRAPHHHFFLFLLLFSLLTLFSSLSFPLPLSLPLVCSTRISLSLSYLPSSPSYDTYLESRVSLYSSLYSNVSIALQRLPEDTRLSINYLKSRYFEQASAYPDMFILDSTWLGDFDEYVETLNPYVSTAGDRGINESIARFDGDMLARHTYAGELKGLPFYYTYSLLFYRQDLLSLYNISAPPSTWDELLLQGQQIQRWANAHPSSAPDPMSYIYGYIWQGYNDASLVANGLEWVASQQAGLQFIRPEGTNDWVVTFDNAKTVDAVRRAQHWLDPVQRGGISPPETLSSTDTMSAASFAAGKSAFYRGWADSLAYFASPSSGSAISGLFNVTLLPGLTSVSESASVHNDFSLAINALSPEENKQEAFKFINWLVSPANQEELARSTYKHPAMRWDFLSAANACNHSSSPSSAPSSAFSLCSLPVPLPDHVIYRPAQVFSPAFLQVSLATAEFLSSALSGGGADIQPALSTLVCYITQVSPSNVHAPECDLPSRSLPMPVYAIVLTAGGAFIVVFGAVLLSLDYCRKRERELTWARDAAQNANKMKGEFLANMSHEIRTPLNGVIGNTQLLQETCTTAEQREFVQQIESSSMHLLTVINDILSFSKLEAGQVELEDRPMDIYQTVEEAIHLSFRAGQDDHLEVTYLVDDDVPQYIMGDVTRLRQICVNLLGNAFKFTKSGQVVVHVSLLASNEQNVLLSSYKSVKPNNRRLTDKDRGEALEGGETPAHSPSALHNNYIAERGDTPSRGDKERGNSGADKHSPADALPSANGSMGPGFSALPLISTQSVNGVSSSSSSSSSSASSSSASSSLSSHRYLLTDSTNEHKNTLEDVDPSTLAQGEFRLQFEVRDSGVGIPEDKIDKLFAAFSQVDATITREYGGTGLGLSITKKLTQLMRGRTWLRSEVGKGSSFYFTMISRDGKAAFERQQRNKSKLLAASPVLFPQISRWAVVSIHENETYQMAFRQQCQRWGLIPLCTASVAEAAAWITGSSSSLPPTQAKRIRLAIIDSHFRRSPDFTTGVAVAAALRDACFQCNSSNVGLPLLLLGNYSLTNAMGGEDALKFQQLQVVGGGGEGGRGGGGRLRQNTSRSNLSPAGPGGNQGGGEGPSVPPSSVTPPLPLALLNPLPNSQSPTPDPSSLSPAHIERLFVRTVRKPVMFMALKQIIYDTITAYIAGQQERGGAEEHSLLIQGGGGGGGGSAPSSVGAPSSNLHINPSSLSSVTPPPQLPPSHLPQSIPSFSPPTTDAVAPLLSPISAPALPSQKALHPSVLGIIQADRSSLSSSSSPPELGTPAIKRGESLLDLRREQTGAPPSSFVAGTAPTVPPQAPLAFCRSSPVPSLASTSILPPSSSSSSSSSSPPGHLYPLRVLLADDDMTNRKLLTRFLLKLGFSAHTPSAREHLLFTSQTAGLSPSSSLPPAPWSSLPRDVGVDQASNGLEAVEKMKALHYDLVFLDMQMPKYSGLEATEMINRWYEGKDVKAQRPVKPYIIALTANALETHKQACLAAGMASYASKPFTMKTLTDLSLEAGENIYNAWREEPGLQQEIYRLKKKRMNEEGNGEDGRMMDGEGETLSEVENGARSDDIFAIAEQEDDLQRETSFVN